MKFSYKWLSEYIDGELPQLDQVVNSLTMHSFEVEGVENIQDDKILDVKILPNRTHDCLSHYGLAMEIASVMDLKRKEATHGTEFPKFNKLKISLDSKLCARAVMIYIKDLKIEESPAWLKYKLKSLGHKSINSVVDITNYLMYCYGQPMHAFDTTKISKNWLGNYDMSVREAKKGEKIKLLNDVEYTLDSGMAVIGDSSKALDVAGIMGSRESSVTFETKEIILSLSSFDAVSVRKTSKTIGLRTDASQRFENDISPVLVDRALPYALKLISEITGGIVVGGTETYPKPKKQRVFSTTVEKISRSLGVSLDESTIVSLLQKQKISCTVKDGEIKVTVPDERLDLEIPENLTEEVGRLYGYNKIPVTDLAEAEKINVNAEVYLSHLIRKVLVKIGFSEIYTYAFANSGQVELENPLASDKKFLRQNLLSFMELSLDNNFKFLDLLGLSQVKLFEIGKVFSEKGESLHLSIGERHPKSKKAMSSDEEIAKAIQTIESELKVSVGNVSIVGGMAEIDLHRFMKEVTIPEKYPDDLFTWTSDVQVVYKPISPYPFAVRDVAVFVPNETPVEKVEEIIKQHFNSNVVRFSLFDTFSKDNKTSYAFRLIFQSSEKTLTDEEINAVMNPIYETLKAQENFEIR